MEGEKMKNLSKAGGITFPLRSSLFWYDNVDRKYESTWPLLCDNWDANKRMRCLQKQIEYGCNTLTYFLYHFDDSGCRVSPLIGNPKPEDIAAGNLNWDWTKIAAWWPYFELGNLPGICLIPTLFCGDSRRATNNTAFHRAFIPPVVQSIHPYITGINIASEASKTMSTAQMEAMIEVVIAAWKAANLPRKFVGVHLQWNGRDRLPANADFLMYEFSWHPGEGHKHSVDDVINEAKRIIAASPLPVLFQELTIECETEIAREQSRALVGLPDVYMIPGPT
ncbi:MAG: hypothetical protein WC329_02955 [Candidatus Omnitrophota bacterium]|jgi:hypothetical protein